MMTAGREPKRDVEPERDAYVEYDRPDYGADVI
jgi:hypothetical protein